MLPAKDCKSFCAISRQYAAFIAVSSAVFSSGLSADGWQVLPRIDAAEIYTSNVALAPTAEEAEYITRFSPGLAINGVGRRLTFDLDYRLQQLLFAKESSRNSTFHQLGSNLNAELGRDTLFLDAAATISQQVIDAEKSISLDNLNLGNRADVMTFYIGPSLRHDFAGFVAIDLSYQHGIVKYQGTNSISDSEVNEVAFSVNSGRHLTQFTWQVDYQESNALREFGADSRRESTTAMMRYQTFSSLAMIARGGRENNEIATTRSSVINGSYWSAGLSWTPSLHFSLDSTYGERYQDANISWSPISRTSLQLSYSEREVGLNTGSSWSGTFRHRTRRTTWQLGYLEDVTNTQFLQLEGQQFSVLIDEQGDLIINPDTGFPIIIVSNVFSLTDEEFLRKNANIGLTLSTAKSKVSMNAYDESREYEISGNVEDVRGGLITWNWRFASRTRSILTLDRQSRDFSSSGREDKLWRLIMEVTTNISPDLSAALEYRNTQRKSSQADADYREHRLMATINKQF